MSISRSKILILITGMLFMVFWGIALFDVFGGSNLYSYRAIAFLLAAIFLSVLILIFVILTNYKKKKKYPDRYWDVRPDLGNRE